MSDRIALTVLEAVTELGLAVPSDVSVVGFDDIPEAARAMPPLTTVRQPHGETGVRAGALLIARLQGNAAKAPALLPTALIVRDLTAPPRHTA